MNRRLHGWIFVSLILLLYSGYALTCRFDFDCFDLTGTFCDEYNQTAGGLAQCSDINASAFISCVDQDLDCTVNADCEGVGSEQCDPISQVCRTSPQPEGGYCAIDLDCEDGSLTCILNTCTNDYPTKCTSNSMCYDNQYCNPTYGYCVERKLVGGVCSYDSHCQEGLVCNAGGLCSECTYDDDSVLALESKFCDETNIVSCDLNYFWMTYSYIGNISYGVIADKVGDGGYCNKDACCVSNNCVDGQCIGGLAGYTVSSSASSFCTDYSSRDLSSEWFDGVADYNTDPDLSFFNTIFNKSNLTILILADETLGLDNITHHTYYRGIDGATGRMDMSAWFYETVSHEVCYFRQRNNYILWNCIDLTITPQAGSNTTTTFYNASFLAQESDAVIASSGMHHIGVSGSCANRWESGITYFMLSTGTYAYADGMIFAFGSNPSPINCQAVLTSAYRTPQEQVFYGSNLWDGTTVAVYPSWNLNRGTELDKRRIGINVLLSPVNPYTQYGLQRFPHISSNPAEDWATTLVTNELQAEDYNCCTHDSDCPTNFCCRGSVCTYCGGGSEVTLSLRAESQTLPVNGSVQITAKLTLGSLPISSKQIAFTTTGGSIAPTSKSTDGLGEAPIVFYPPPDTTGNYTITASFAGDSTYNPKQAQIIIIVTNDSNWIRVRIIKASTSPLDALTGIQGVTIEEITNALPDRWTDSLGFAYWGNLAPIPQSYVLRISKEGYETFYGLVEINEGSVFILRRTNQTGYDEQPLPSFEWDVTVPENAEDVTSGLENLTRNIFAYYMPWIFIIVVFLLSLSIIRLLIDHATA